MLLAVCLGDARPGTAQQMPAGDAPSTLPPPAAIAGLPSTSPAAVEFARGWLGKAAAVRLRRAELLATGQLDGMSLEALASIGGALTGVLRVPVIPLVYADVRVPFAESVLERRLFGESSGDTASYAAYWREVSAGLLEVEGTVAPWTRLSRTAEHYLPTKEHGWARFGRMDEVWNEGLASADRALDFGRFDNDGPDGVPNSGDDDGYVDFVAFVYANRCDRLTRAGAIWPHRGAMPPYETNDTSALGGPIRITDYVIQAAVETGSCAPMHVGVLAHETGHAFGLPDLYDYDGSSQGIGAWGLMGTGSHSARWSPAHPSAWEKEQLGWVRVQWLRSGSTTLRVAPVTRSHVVYRYDVPDRAGEYLLLENRQRLGTDQRLPGAGLLVWHVDPERGELGAWNSDERWGAIALIAADGRADLQRGAAADAGDPFPGRAAKRRLALPWANGLRLDGIRESFGDVVAELRVDSARPTLRLSRGTVGLIAPRGGASSNEVAIGVSTSGTLPAWSVSPAAKWLRVRRSADTLWLSAEPRRLSPGTYADTIELRAEGDRERSARVVVYLRVATNAPEVVARELPWSWGLAAERGSVVQASYGWDPLALRPRPRLLQLWDGNPQPATLTRLPAEALFAPVADGDGGLRVLARAQGTNYVYQVARNGQASVIVAGFGVGPTYGAAAMPDGSLAVSDWSGRISRVHADGRAHPWFETGSRLYQLATDAAGVLYAATYHGDVLRIEPTGRARIIPTGFGEGRLVAIAATPEGDVFVAERGGRGRILRLSVDGRHVELARVKGAQFYGLTVDEGFLYAADLKNRQLLRVPIPVRVDLRMARGP